MFIVVATAILNTNFDNQQSVSFGTLQQIGQAVRYNQLKPAIDFVLDLPAER